MTAYTRVKVKPDTEPWLEERKHSVGASESAAVLGMSPYDTAFDVWRAKNGHGKLFDGLLGWIGHASEPLIRRWIEEQSALDVALTPGFMARSRKWPWLHASFDLIGQKDGAKFPVQLKTASARAADRWDHGETPVEYVVQVQQEMAVHGSDIGLLVAWIGGRDFEHRWIERDDEFILGHLVPRTREFFERSMVGGVPPAPQTLADAKAVWRSKALPVTADSAAIEASERRAILLSDMKAMEAEADALQLALATYMEEHDQLVDVDGQVILTYRDQPGRRQADLEKLRVEFPDAYDACVAQGQPVRVMRYASKWKKRVLGDGE